MESHSESHSHSESAQQYLTFRIADGEYAIGILRVREIIEFETTTEVPATPPWIRGVINLRGTVVPVVDLAAKLALPPTPVTSRTCIIIVETDLDGETVNLGVMADEVSQVVELGEDEVEEPPAFGARIHVDYLLGMGNLGDRLVLILDIDRVLRTDELLAAASAAQEEPDAA